MHSNEDGSRQRRAWHKPRQPAPRSILHTVHGSPYIRLAWIAKGGVSPGHNPNMTSGHMTQWAECIGWWSRSNNLNLPLDLQIKLFDNTILPILTYGSEVFGCENIEILEGVHLQFLRKIGKLRKSTPKYMLYAEFGRYPIKITIKQRMANFWARILNGKTSKLSYQVYLYMLNTNEQEYKWVKCIQTILNEVGRQDIWLRQTYSVPRLTGKIIKQILTDQFFAKLE